GDVRPEEREQTEPDRGDAEREGGDAAVQRGLSQNRLDEFVQPTENQGDRDDDGKEPHRETQKGEEEDARRTPQHRFDESRAPPPETRPWSRRIVLEQHERRLNQKARPDDERQDAERGGRSDDEVDAQGDGEQCESEANPARHAKSSV